MKTTSTTRPQTLEVKMNRFHQKERTVNFDITYNRKTKEYDFESVTIAPGNFNRGAVIDAIIRAHYDQPAMEAINNNYLDDPTSEKAIAERNEMKAWRLHAKEIAGGLSYE